MGDRVSTGVANLDEALQGGYPRGNIILVAGNAGTGKTHLAGEFILNGASEGENVLYVSLSEGREAFLEYLAGIGKTIDEEMLQHIHVMDLVTVKEQGVETLLEMVTSCVEEEHTERLVIDSFTAIASAFTEAIDARVTLHLLSKIVKGAGCTTLLVTEIQQSRDSIGRGVEEFIADGVIILRRENRGGDVIRTLELTKMRGTEIRQTTHIFTLNRGFRVLKPFDDAPVKRPRRFQPLHNTERGYSTGQRQLDAILGGIREGDTVLVQVREGVPQAASALILGPLRAQFIASGQGVVTTPAGGESVERLLASMRGYGFTDDEIGRLLRVATPSTDEEKRPGVIHLDPSDPRTSIKNWNDEKTRLIKETGSPVLKTIHLNPLANAWPPDQVTRAMEAESAQTKREHGLFLIATKPGTERLTRGILNFCNVHLRLTSERGTLLLQGMQPRTPLYVFEADPEADYPRPRLTPLQ